MDQWNLFRVPSNVKSLIYICMIRLKNFLLQWMSTYHFIIMIDYKND